MLSIDHLNLITHRGSPYPLGVSYNKKGINFALYSKNAMQVTLGIFAPHEKDPKIVIPLDPIQNKTGFIWHLLIEELPQNYYYAYRLEGPCESTHCFNGAVWLIDPFAKELNISSNWGEKKEPFHGKIFPNLEFDWGNDVPLNLPYEDLMIYEMHVRGMTQDSSSHVASPGTFLGLIEKIPYLKDLGITAVELLPIFEFDETKNAHKNPITGGSLCNYWGYMTLNFFSPMSRYGTIIEFKQMVKEFHKAGIEVILDVVFNHTGEDPQNKPPLSFRGIDNETYYILDQEGKDLDFTGCGNTFNCNQTVTTHFILSALRYWVSEMHIDGFRFDLASIFCRDSDGEVLDHPPIIREINNDPLLAHTKLIAEAWDAAGLYQVGSFPGGKRWSEWNGKFRDVTRCFLKGDKNKVGAFATVLAGSQDLYGYNRSPCHSINFVTAHDGFTLRDLVSYNQKHNEENGEGNQDGNNSNDSWNCGVEGETNNPQILELRNRQMKNFLLALTVSLGTPMFNMGDEYGHSRQGNNNPYCQDNKKNYFLWDELEKNKELLQFFKNLIQFRKNSSLLRRKTFLTEKDVIWHGVTPESPHWTEESHYIAYTLIDHKNHQDLYIAFNAQNNSVGVHLPEPPVGKKWTKLFDTGNSLQKTVKNYELSSYSSIIFQAS